MGRHDEEPSAIDAREVALRFGLGEPVDPVAVWELRGQHGC